MGSKCDTQLVERHLSDSIGFHDVMHVFRVRIVTGMDTLEAKLLHHIVSMSQEIMYDIFLDIHKAYYVLDWGHALAILGGYGVVLLPGNHGGESEMILWGPLPGLPGCHPGGTTFPRYLQFCGGINCLPLVWYSGREIGWP